jgi:hypothetical protein
MKTLHNTTANGATKNVKDIQFWGNGDTFKLISKASSENEGWMKSTKAMEIEFVGCVVQVTTQQRTGHNVRFLTKDELVAKYGEDHPVYEQYSEPVYVIAEAVTFVPGVKLEEVFENDKCVLRKLVKIWN